MKLRARDKKTLTVCIVLAVITIVFGAVMFAHSLSQMTVQMENQNANLFSEYSANNAYSAKQELQNALNTIKVSAETFIDYSDLKCSDAQAKLRTLAEQTPFSTLLIATPDGIATDGNGKEFDISATSYFKRTILGENSIMKDDPSIDIDDGTLIVSAPVIENGKAVGTLHGCYNKFSLSQIIETQNLDGESYSAIINQNGDMILCSVSDKRVDKTDGNFYNFMGSTELADGVTADSLKSDIVSRKAGSSQYTLGDNTREFFYTPIGVNDWYLVKMVTQDYIDNSIKPVKNLVFGLTAVMIVLCIILAVIVIAIISAFNKNKNEQLVNAYAQAEHANSAKSSFLSRMSHEIRTPMNAIVGLTNIAKTHAGDRDKTINSLEKIESSSKILLNIINDVLDVSAIESDKLKIGHTDFDIKELLNSISTVYYAQCKQKGIDFEMATADINYEILIGDSLRVNQILLNLISNAFKFTDKGGKITVIVSETLQDEKAFLHITVTDTGEGMEPEMIDRLFKPFEQESALTAQKHGGSGLGLSIVKSLIELMHGAINVESKKGVGTTFSVDIPFDYEKKLSHEDKTFSEIKALIVDDDKDSTEYTSVVLDRLGVKYSIANSGESAIETIKTANENGENFDICFVDWKMPGMNGVDVTKKIRSLNEDKTVVIIVSAYDLSEIEDEATDAGADMFVPKPLFQSTVFNLLMSITGGKFKKAKKKHDDGAYDFTGHRVLMAEDNMLNTEIAIELLHMVNMEVDTAENGQLAVEKFRSSEAGKYDCILMDIQMPVMGGHEAAKAIRSSSHPEAATIPIYAMTANAFTEDVSAALAAGMNGHIAKPIDTKILFSTLKKVISDKQK